MKSAFFFFNFISYLTGLIYVHGDCVWYKEYLKAVTRFRGLDEFYLHIRQNTHEEDETLSGNYSLALKWICSRLFNSHYFRMLQEDVLKTEQVSCHKEVKTYYQNIFENFYRNSKLLKKKESGGTSYLYHHEHYYEVKKVYLGEHVIDEQVFTCLARERKTKKIKEYFVSQSYNITPNADNDSSNSEETFGRFIFSYNVENNLVVYALAEQARGEVFSVTRYIEEFYLSQKNATGSSRMPEETVCELSSAEKLRLCATVLSSFRLTYSFQFWPSPHNVGKSCQQMQVSFRTDDLYDLDEKTSYKEWMFTCRAVHLSENRKVTIYISRASEKNRYFVYKRSEDSIFLDHYSANVKHDKYQCEPSNDKDEDEGYEIASRNMSMNESEDESMRTESAYESEDDGTKCPLM